VHQTDDTHGVTTLELLFDLVFVYGMTQVTAFMARDLTGWGILRGMVLMGMLWFGWTAYAWLGNQAKADEGPLRASLIIAMAAMFVVALTMPESFSDEPGGWYGPLVFVVAYAVVRVVHIVVYVIAAGSDTGLRRQVLRSGATGVVPLALLVVGAVVGAPYQVACWVAAVVLDYGGIYALGASGWRLPSAHHFSERHGLVIIIAIGESIVAVGMGLDGAPISGALIAGAVLGIAVAVCLWWTYFDVVALVAGRRLTELQGAERTAMARDSYTYLHLPMVAGIVLLALGGKVLLHDVAAHSSHISPVAVAALYGGTALYLLAHIGFRWRNVHSLNHQRLLACALLVGLAVVGSVGGTALPPMLHLSTLAALLVVLVTYEVIRFAGARDDIRHAQLHG
jgi:low temperature requirement protein LtrA